MSLRLIINVIWLIKTIENKVFTFFKFLHKLAYKGMQFLAGTCLIPLLGMALKASTTVSYQCFYNSYFDTRSNADIFMNYFFIIDDDNCFRCSQASIVNDPSCYKVCSTNYSEPKYRFQITKDHSMFTKTFADLYLIPIFIFDFFYVVFFIFCLRLIYKKALDVLVFLPAPTKNIECKFQTLINTLDSAALNTFRSFRYRNALYSFAFTEGKLFVYFWTNLTFCGYLPIPYDYDPIILCFVVSLASFFIAESQIFTSPYNSILHNIVNFFSYSVSGISSLLVGLHLSHIFTMHQQLAIFLVILIVVTPIITAVISPFFVKKDPLLVPTKFDLLLIQKWDKKINQIINFRYKQSEAKKAKKNGKIDDVDDDFENGGVLLENEPSVSIDYFENNDEQRDHDFLVSNFELIKLAPIQIQEKLNSNY